MRRWSMLVLAVACAAVTGCEKMSGYQVRLEALRATRELEEPVPLSLWLYPGAKTKELTKVFVSGRISGVQWIEFETTKYVDVPAADVDADGFFNFRIELNPNRLATPPDAIFRALAPLPGVVALGENISDPIVMRAEAGAPFEVRLRFRRSTAL